ncbi:MAG TPA: hypothetical protein VE650_16070 [Acetobacteraceae bacterium]|nr:hypothetical protein [Acetobacteraceae bacterium]
MPIRFALLLCLVAGSAPYASANARPASEACTVPLGPAQGLRRPAGVVHRASLVEMLGPGRHAGACGGRGIGRT